MPTAHIPSVCTKADIQFMTRGCCEPVNDCAEALASAGLEAGDINGYWYPLKGKELDMVSEEHIAIGDFWALASYSALYKGQKYLSLEVEIPFGRGMGSREDAYTVHLKALRALTRVAEKVSGHVRWSASPEASNGDLYGHYGSALMVPMSYALEHATTFKDWKLHIEWVAMLSLARPDGD